MGSSPSQAAGRDRRRYGGRSPASFARSGQVLVHSIARDGVVVARDGQLVSLLQHELPEDGSGRARGLHRGGHGRHRRAGRARARRREDRRQPPVRRAGARWLPFAVRLVFAAGGRSVRMVHTFVFDGDAERDFLAGLGVRVRRADARRAARPARALRRAPTAGCGPRRCAGSPACAATRAPTCARRRSPASRRPPVAELEPARSPSRLELIPAWGDFTLAQLSRRRVRDPQAHRAPATAGSAPRGGTRADGLRLRRRRPAAGSGSACAISGSATRRSSTSAARRPSRREVTLWLYSPEAPPMDLRFYHDGLGLDDYASSSTALEITYEDYEPGFGTPHGIARTREMMLFAYAATPPSEALADDVDTRCSAPPLLAADTRALARGGRVRRLEPRRPLDARREQRIEDQLDFLVRLLRRQVEQRRWYGFWDLRRRDAHLRRRPPRVALRRRRLRVGQLRALAGPVAVVRVPPQRPGGRVPHGRGDDAAHRRGRRLPPRPLRKGLGTRHNVQHWGCSAKQLRISTRGLPAVLLLPDRRRARRRPACASCATATSTFLALDPLRKVRTEPFTPRAAARWASGSASTGARWRRRG